MAKEPKAPKFNFEKLKTEAMSPDPQVRKETFKEYFERFEEFPTYFFDNSNEIDQQLFQTIEDIRNDPETPSKMQKGITTLMERLPSPKEVQGSL